MKNTLSTLSLLLISLHLVCCQDTSSSDSMIIYHINDNVKNSDQDYFNEIFSSWKNYLNSDHYVRAESEYWNQDEYSYPDYGYVSMLMNLRRKASQGLKTQCSIIGIVPAKKDYYLVKSIFTEKKDSSELININFITSVYAKKNRGEYQFYSSTQYFKEIYESEKVGNISYIVHPEHVFDREAAVRMDAFNLEISKKFEMTPLYFDYVVANDSRDLANVLGVQLFEYSYQPVASGGMADTYNNVIYAGNNSEYYPHEVVHLYTHAKFPRQSHHWVDEGIAALIGGSTGYDIEWHWEKLRRFVEKSPDYAMDNLVELQIHIPNGEFMTDFRYAIGALICQRIIDKEGMKGIFDALQAGRSEDNYFDVLKRKLNIDKEDFGTYVKAEVLKMAPKSDAEMASYAY